MKMYYQAAVINQNSWCPVTGNKSVIETCGHKHQTAENAYKCVIPKANTMANWRFTGTVIDQDNKQVNVSIY
jgi:hypothetical protein